LTAGWMEDLDNPVLVVVDRKKIWVGYNTLFLNKWYNINDQIRPNTSFCYLCTSLSFAHYRRKNMWGKLLCCQLLCREWIVCVHAQCWIHYFKVIHEHMPILLAHAPWKCTTEQWQESFLRTLENAPIKGHFYQ
jgi:hypothetical protein